VPLAMTIFCPISVFGQTNYNIKSQNFLGNKLYALAKLASHVEKTNILRICHVKEYFEVAKSFHN